MKHYTPLITPFEVKSFFTQYGKATSWLRKSIALAVLVVVITSMVNCGGEGKPAPYTPHGQEDAQCPSLDALSVHTKAALRNDDLSAIAPVVNNILLDDGGLRVLFPLAVRLLTRVPPADILSVAQGFEDGKGLARMVPHLVQVLSYMDGRSEYIAGQHYGPLDATHRILSQCAPLATLGAAKRILELEEALDNGEVVPWIELFADALVDVADDVFFRNLLATVEFEGEAQGDLQVGREAFTLLAHLIATNIAAENFDLLYIRDLLDTVLASQLAQDESRQKFDRLINLLERLVSEDEAVFPYVQSFMKCANDVDEQGDIAILLYDYLAIRELDLVNFLQDVRTVEGEAAGTNMRIIVIDTLTVLEETPVLTTDAISILSRFISPDVSRDTVPALHDLKGLGVATEAVLFLRNITRGCAP